MKTIKAEDYLDKRLKDPKEAAAYLTAVAEEGDAKTFLIALADVARAMKTKSIAA